MITIEINYDSTFFTGNASEIPRDISGVYLLLNSNDEVLYVGIAEDLKYRVRQHLLKQGNTRWFTEPFEKISLIYEEDPLKRRVAEMYLINTLHPPANKQGVHPESISDDALENEHVFNQCQGLTAVGERCVKVGHSNGYCHYHGGNGISISSLRTTYDQKFLKKKFLESTTPAPRQQQKEEREAK